MNDLTDIWCLEMILKGRTDGTDLKSLMSVLNEADDLKRALLVSSVWATWTENEKVISSSRSSEDAGWICRYRTRNVVEEMEWCALVERNLVSESGEVSMSGQAKMRKHGRFRISLSKSNDWKRVCKCEWDHFALISETFIRIWAAATLQCLILWGIRGREQRIL